MEQTEGSQFREKHETASQRKTQQVVAEEEDHCSESLTTATEQDAFARDLEKVLNILFVVMYEYTHVLHVQCMLTAMPSKNTQMETIGRRNTVKLATSLDENI